MIKDSKLLQKFENDYAASTPANLEENLRIVSALYQQACDLGVFPLANPLEGIETDIALAKVLNSV